MDPGDPRNRRHNHSKKTRIRHFHPEEQAAIRVHKYFLSQNRGHDVGETAAVQDWLANHACRWNHEQDVLAQCEEMRKHRWIQSEKAGRDLGEAAYQDWILHHAETWRRERDRRNGD